VLLVAGEQILRDIMHATQEVVLIEVVAIPDAEQQTTAMLALMRDKPASRISVAKMAHQRR